MPRPSFREDCRWIAERCRRRFGAARTFSLAFKALNLIVLAPLAAGLLRLCLWMWGRASVGNFEIAFFFLSPAGLIALLAVGGVMLASLYLELSGLTRILADDRLPWWDAFRGSTRLFPRLVHLGLRQLAIFLASAAPFLAGVGWAYARFWSGRDLNGLIILQPPEFWWGVGCAAILLALYASLALWLFLRQLFAVPILLLEPGTDVPTALRLSAERTRGRLLRSAAALAAWFAAYSLLAALLLGSLHFVLQAWLNWNRSSVSQLIVAAGTAFVVQAVAVTLLSIAGNISFVGVVLALYRQSAPDGAVPEISAAAQPRTGLRTWHFAAVLAVGAASAIACSVSAIRGVKLHDTLEITAHRAGATHGPENTVAALKQAIADGADWAEIDVQLTSDQALVVMHDIDLARVGGGPKRVDQATLAEIQALDVGAAFGPQFAGERIPEFKDFLAAAGDRIRLNVELKPHGKADGPELTRRVVAEIRAANMTARCRICSQSYESLLLARELEPAFETGYIVATAVGDPTKLNVQFLMVKGKLATPAFVARAAARKITVHAWTVNDPNDVAPLLDAGVANLITDDPLRMRAELERIRELSVPERLLLRTTRAAAR